MRSGGEGESQEGRVIVGGGSEGRDRTHRALAVVLDNWLDLVTAGVHAAQAVLALDDVVPQENATCTPGYKAGGTLGLAQVALKALAVWSDIPTLHNTPTGPPVVGRTGLDFRSKHNGASSVATAAPAPPSRPNLCVRFIHFTPFYRTGRQGCVW